MEDSRADDCLFAKCLRAGDGKIDDTGFLFRFSMDDGEVGLLHLSIGEAFFERFKCFLCFGDEEESGGVFVQSMHNAGAQGILADTENVRIICRDPVCYRVLSLGVGRVDLDAGRFVEDKEVFVFEYDGDMDVWVGEKHSGFRLGEMNIDGYLVIFPEQGAWFGGVVVYDYISFANIFYNMRA